MLFVVGTIIISMVVSIVLFFFSRDYRPTYPASKLTEHFANIHIKLNIQSIQFLKCFLNIFSLLFKGVIGCKTHFYVVWT